MTRLVHPLLVATALAGAAACELHDDVTWHPWVPVEAMTGPLQPEVGAGYDAPPPDGALRVVTYNVHLGSQLDVVEASLRDLPALAAAHVLVLEEIEAHPADPASQAARLGAALGMNHVYAPAWAYADGGTHGIAVLSRYPITEARVMQLPYFDLVEQSEQRIAVAVTLAVGGVPLEIVGVHLDTRINVNQRLQQLEPAVRGAAAATIVAGDFNANTAVWILRQLPSLPQDAAAPIDTIGAIDAYMGYWGFAAPTAGAGDTTNAVVGMRIDAIYPRGHAPLGAGVERSASGSDHFPVWADVAWP